MLNDLSFAFRSLARSSNFCVIAVTTLALGIGLNTGIFSMLNGLLLRPLSFPEADQLFRLERVSTKQRMVEHSSANFADLLRDSEPVAELAAFRFSAFNLTENNQPADVPIALGVSANFFHLLGLRPIQGRDFRSDENAPGKNNVIMISHAYWQSHFSGAPDVVGRTVRLDGDPTEIIGILPPTLDFSRLWAPVGIFRPLGLTTTEAAERNTGNLNVIGRRHRSITSEQATELFRTLAQRLATDHPTANAGVTLFLRDLKDTTLTGSGRTVTFLVLGLAGLVLLIACANLANLMLARAISRTREFSVRAALGASRGQLMRPLIAECVVLALLGGTASLFVSAWTSDWLAREFGDATNPVDFSIDGRVLVFALGASLCTALLFGIGPAWWSSRVNVNETLKRGGRGPIGSASQTRYRQWLIVAQFALALVLLVGAGLFIRGLSSMINTHTGWKPDQVISGVLNLSSNKYSTAEPIIAFHEELRRRLLELPGVVNTSVSFEIPLFNSPSQQKIHLQGHESVSPGAEPIAFFNGITPNFFDTFQTRVVRGRAFDQTDGLKSRSVVMINESMARTLFPGTDPIGQHLALAGQTKPNWAEIVGLVEDTRPLNFASPPSFFQVYKPFSQEAWQYVSIALRISPGLEMGPFLKQIRLVVAEIDPDLPVLRLMPVTERIKANTQFLHTLNQLLGCFAVLGLLLAALGIYGVVTRMFAQRVGEIGLRLALGAAVSDILRLVLGAGLRMAFAGILVGAVSAWGFAWLVSRSLPGFADADPFLVVLAALLLMAIGLVASFFPARRAAKLDPAVALRAE